MTEIKFLNIKITGFAYYSYVSHCILRPALVPLPRILADFAPRLKVFIFFEWHTLRRLKSFMEFLPRSFQQMFAYKCISSSFMRCAFYVF